MNIVYSLGIDESGKYYSIEEHEYNIGSAYSFATEYFILEDSEVKELRRTGWMPLEPSELPGHLPMAGNTGVS